jgi:hypothetical protein
MTFLEKRTLRLDVAIFDFVRVLAESNIKELPVGLTRKNLEPKERLKDSCRRHVLDQVGVVDLELLTAFFKEIQLPMFVSKLEDSINSQKIDPYYLMIFSKMIVI